MTRSAQAPQVIGHGCTTAYFIDDDCDGCGVGVKSSGQYPLTQNPAAVGTTAYLHDGRHAGCGRYGPDGLHHRAMAGEVGNDEPGNDELPAAAQGLHQHEPHFLRLARAGTTRRPWSTTRRIHIAAMAPIMTPLEDLQGGVVIVEGGTCTDGLVPQSMWL